MRYLKLLFVPSAVVGAALTADAAYRLTCPSGCQPSPVNLSIPLWLSLTIGILLISFVPWPVRVPAELFVTAAIFAGMSQTAITFWPLLFCVYLLWTATQALFDAARRGRSALHLNRTGTPAIATVIGLRRPFDVALWVVPQDGSPAFAVERSFRKAVFRHLRQGASVGALVDRDSVTVFPVAAGRSPERVAALCRHAESLPSAAPNPDWITPPALHRSPWAAATAAGFAAAVWAAFAFMAWWPDETSDPAERTLLLLLAPVVAGAIARGLGSGVTLSFMVSMAALGAWISGAPRAWIVAVTAAFLALAGFFGRHFIADGTTIRDHGIAAVATVTERWPSKVTYSVQPVDGSEAFIVHEPVHPQATLDVGSTVPALVHPQERDLYRIYADGDIPLRLSAFVTSLAQDRPIAR